MIALEQNMIKKSSVYEWRKLTSAFRIQNSLELLGTAILNQNYYNVWECLLLCSEKEIRARTKPNYGRTASHCNSRYSYFSTFWFAFFFFFAWRCESMSKGKKVIQKHLTFWYLYEPEKFSVCAVCALLGFYINREIYTIWYSSRNILYKFLSYPSLTFSNTHGRALCHCRNLQAVLQQSQD